MKRFLAILLFVLLGFHRSDAITFTVITSGTNSSVVTNTVNNYYTNTVVQYSASNYFFQGVAAGPLPLDFQTPMTGEESTWKTNWIERYSPSNIILILRNGVASGGGNQPDSFRFWKTDSSGNHYTAITNYVQPSSIVVVQNGTTNTTTRVSLKRSMEINREGVSFNSILNFMSVECANAITDNAPVTVTATGSIFQNIPGTHFVGMLTPSNYTQAVHNNQVGYHPNQPKIGVVQWYQGTNTQEFAYGSVTFHLWDLAAGSNVFTGTSTRYPEPDWGWAAASSPNQECYQCNFSAFQTPGRYKILVDGVGAGPEFVIDDQMGKRIASTAIKGMYGVRCGTNITDSFSGITHGVCHAGLNYPGTNSASLLWSGNNFISVGTSATAGGVGYGNASDNNWNADELLLGGYAALPAWADYVNLTPRACPGGHHDAGDYSIYMISCGNMVGWLTDAIDMFPNVAGMDDLGLPTSGDGIPDLVQEAKWEVDKILGMQDSDGGIFFINYPIAEKYENVPPDQRQERVFYPKNTSATMLGGAALAYFGSSPTVKRYYPSYATNCVQQATRAFSWCTNAFVQAGGSPSIIGDSGYTNSYFRVTHYGNEMGHADEWAAMLTSLWAATGNTNYLTTLSRFQTSLLATGNFQHHWHWPLEYEGVGFAQRAMAFAIPSGRRTMADVGIYTNMWSSGTGGVYAAAISVTNWYTKNAWGVPFPTAQKNPIDGNYYFSGKTANIAIQKYVLDQFYGKTPDPLLKEIALRCLDADWGNNAANICNWFGIGQNQQLESISQWTRYDNKLGHIFGFPYGTYSAVPASGATAPRPQESYEVQWPPLADGAPTTYFPLYERGRTKVANAGDREPTTQELAPVVATSLGIYGLLMEPTNGTYTCSIVDPGGNHIGTAAQLSAVIPGIDTSQAQFTWDMISNGVSCAAQPLFVPALRTNAVTVEVTLPSGRVIVGSKNVIATP